MLETIGSALASLAILALIVGLINPNWVLFGNINKTRGKVIAVYGFVFIFAFVVQIIGSPNSFETGKKAFLEIDDKYIVNIFCLSTHAQHFAHRWRTGRKG